MEEEEQGNLHKPHVLDFLGKRWLFITECPLLSAFSSSVQLQKNFTISKYFPKTYKLLHSIKKRARPELVGHKLSYAVFLLYLYFAYLYTNMFNYYQLLQLFCFQYSNSMLGEMWQHHMVYQCEITECAKDALHKLFAGCSLHHMLTTSAPIPSSIIIQSRTLNTAGMRTFRSTRNHVCVKGSL